MEAEMSIEVMKQALEALVYMVDAKLKEKNA